LLVGLGLGMFYEPSPEYFLILVSGALLTFFFSVMLEGVIGKYGLPYLSVPFLLALWMVALASRQYTQLEISERGIFSLNEMFALGGISMVRAYEWFDGLNLAKPVVVYFRSLGAIFFQYHLFPGLLIAIGLLIYSRIAFTLSVLGFSSAYIFYQAVGANISELNYAYIGFNYILTGIAIGGFFTIPSKYSYLWVVVLTPLTAIILTATNTLFISLQLSIYSLPFNIVVLVFIYALKFRERALKNPQLTVIQHYSPEKNIYYHDNHYQRFGEEQPFKMVLPFFGEWKVTQGYQGEITHKEGWAHALDFEVFDHDDKKFKGSGDSVEDYYCFNKPVVAPADGWIEKIRDDIDDNAIGDVDLVNNWGNTIVIRHAPRAYSALSHLKKGSITVKPGEFVKKGDVIARCGNSGRSPFPHLHFQVQDMPDIGTKTISYPLSRYITKVNGRYDLVLNRIPVKGETLGNVDINKSLQKAFHFVPGRSLMFDVVFNSQNEQFTWDVEADIFKNTYITCRITGARAYFVYEDDMIWFTSYEGKKKTLLYYFYLSSFRVIFGFYPDLMVKDIYPLPAFTPKWALFWQDLLAPFARILKAEYSMKFEKIKGQFGQHEIYLSSSARYLQWGKVGRGFDFSFRISNRRIEEFTVTSSGKTILTAKWHVSS
jgi:urea transporter